MASEAEDLLHKVLHYFRTTEWIRNTLLALLLICLLGVSSFYAYTVMPKTYTVTMTGGDILGNRHFLTRILQGALTDEGVNLLIRPTEGSLSALAKVSEHKIDLALVQGGVQKNYPNVYQLASLPPEIVHLVVKPKYNSITDLKGAVINVGSPNDGTRAIASEILRFAGFAEKVDYAPSTLADEDLVSLPAERLPDAMFILSLAPSYLAEFMVRERGYKLIEIPFPEALALHNGWTAGAQILPYTYNVNPPIPATTIKSVGIPMLLVAHADVNPAATVKVMEALFGKVVANRSNMKFSDENITANTGYQLSPIVLKYLSRNDEILSKKTVAQAKDWFGAIMSIATTLLLLIKWFRSVSPPETPAEPIDPDLHKLLAELATMPKQDQLSPEQHQLASIQLNAIREKVIELKTSGLPLKDASLPEFVLLTVSDMRAALAAQLAA